MRFAAKRTFSRFALKAELILHRLFNWEGLYNSHSSDKYAGTCGEVTPSGGGEKTHLGCELILNRLLNRENSYTLQSRNKRTSIFKSLTQKFRHAFCTLFACKAELTLSQPFKYGNSHTLQSRNVESSESRRNNPLWGRRNKPPWVLPWWRY